MGLTSLELFAGAGGMAWRAAWQTFPPDWRWQGSQAIGREIVRAAS